MATTGPGTCKISNSEGTIAGFVLPPSAPIKTASFAPVFQTLKRISAALTTRDAGIPCSDLKMRERGRREDQFQTLISYLLESLTEVD
jgi:hypothetical protein